MLGQYVTAGGKPGCLDDPTVPDGSSCPAFAALMLWVNSERWQGLPAVLKANTALDEAKVEIKVQSKDSTSNLLATAGGNIMRNELVFRVQPNGGRLRQGECQNIWNLLRFGQCRTRLDLQGPPQRGTHSRGIRDCDLQRAAGGSQQLCT